MWAEGSIKVGDSIFHYWVKHYEEPSEDYGIDGGRVFCLFPSSHYMLTVKEETDLPL